MFGLVVERGPPARPPDRTQDREAYPKLLDVVPILDPGGFGDLLPEANMDEVAEVALIIRELRLTFQEQTADQFVWVVSDPS